MQPGVICNSWENVCDKWLLFSTTNCPIWTNQAPTKSLEPHQQESAVKRGKCRCYFQMKLRVGCGLFFFQSLNTNLILYHPLIFISIWVDWRYLRLLALFCNYIQQSKIQQLLYNLIWISDEYIEHINCHTYTLKQSYFFDLFHVYHMSNFF